MKVLVVGRGWTGMKVFNEFNGQGVDTQITNHGGLDGYDLAGFDWVVNCAGVTGLPNVDACEDDPQSTYHGNALFPIRLRQRLQGMPTRLAHFSSGCIYQGSIDSVDAEPNFFGSTYSTSKGISDSVLKVNSVVFRIRMPFTNKHESKNYLSKVKNYAVNGVLYDGGPNSLTDHDEAIGLGVGLILKNTPDGAYNLVNQGAVDLKWIIDRMELPNQPTWVDAKEFAKITRCQRSNCVIPAHPMMSDVQQALERAISEGGF